MTFDEVTTWTRTAEGWTGTLPPEWGQGRAAFGGVVAAAGLRALRTFVPAERTPRTVTTTFYGPVTPEPATMTARIVRAGRSLTFAEAEIAQGTLRARVAATFAADRESVTSIPEQLVALPDPDGFVDFPVIPGVIPAFMQQIHSKWTEGSFPFSGATDGTVLAALLRFHEPPARGWERLLALLDVMPAPVLQQLDRPAPASSIVWTTHFVAPDAGEPGDWSFFRYETLSASGGYCTALGKLYDARGRLVAWSEQLHAVFG